MENRDQVIAVSHLEARLQAIEAEIRRLATERDVLRRIMDTAPRLARHMVVPTEPASSKIVQAMTAGTASHHSVTSTGAVTTSPRMASTATGATFTTLPENVARQKPRTDQIVDYVRDNEGRTSGEIAEVLVRLGMAANAAEPKKLIQTVLGQLVQQGRLRRNEDGRLYVVV